MLKVVLKQKVSDLSGSGEGVFQCEPGSWMQVLSLASEVVRVDATFVQFSQNGGTGSREVFVVVTVLLRIASPWPRERMAGLVIDDDGKSGGDGTRGC
jgi:hypothetical protein